MDATPASAATSRKRPKIRAHAVGLRALISAFLAKAGVLRLGERLGLRLALFRPRPSEGLVGAGTQVNVDVIDVAHDIRIGAECRHDVFLCRAYVLAPTRHDGEEIAVAEPLERILQRWRIARSFAVGTVANVALRVIAPIARVGVPVDGAVSLYLVSWASILVEVLAVHGLDRGWISRSVGASRHAGNHRQPESNRKKTVSHGRFPCGLTAACFCEANRRAPFGKAPAAAVGAVASV